MTAQIIGSCGESGGSFLKFLMLHLCFGSFSTTERSRVRLNFMNKSLGTSTISFSISKKNINFNVKSPLKAGAKCGDEL